VSRDFLAVTRIKSVLEAVIIKDPPPDSTEAQLALAELDKLNYALLHVSTCSVCSSQGFSPCPEAIHKLRALGVSDDNSQDGYCPDHPDQALVMADQRFPTLQGTVECPRCGKWRHLTEKEMSEVK
jgi:hypothetical protein